MFKKAKKVVICTVLTAATIFAENNVSAAIAQDGTNPVTVQSVNTLGSKVGLNISNAGNASVSSSIVGKAGTSKIRVIIKLQKYDNSSKSWKKVKTWDKTFYSANVSYNPTYQLKNKGTYRCKLSAEVWRNGIKENVNLSSGSKTY